MIGLILTICVSSYSAAEEMRIAAYRAVQEHPSNQVTVIFVESSDVRCQGGAQ